MAASCLTIVSGKGGSGKTTLALTLAQLLMNSSKNVLLIDCDMSTYGATYFLKPILMKGEGLYQLEDLANGIINFEMKNENDKGIFKYVYSQSKSFDFLPSRTDILTDDEIDELYPPIIALNDINFKDISRRYDIIIFDCQAGYSMINKDAIKRSHKSLVVLEPDLVSGYAGRTLYLQMRKQFDAINSYQVFNKVAKDEMHYYEELPKYGMFYVNLKPLSFNWKVRESFGICEIPDISVLNNLLLTDEICGLAISLFPEFKLEILEYSLVIKKAKLYKIENDKLEFKEKIKSIKKPRKYITLVFSWISFILPVILTNMRLITDYLLIGFSLLSFALYSTTIYLSFFQKPKKIIKKTLVKDEMSDINEKISKAESELKNIQKVLDKLPIEDANE